MSLTKVYIMQRKHQRQEDPLNLSSLPLATPPDEDGWPAIQQTLLAQNSRRRFRQRAGGALAAAAAVVLVLTLVMGRPDPVQHNVSPIAAPGAKIVSSETPGRPPALESLMALSQQLEAQLRIYRDELGDLPAGALVYQIELQDLVAQVDEEISTDPDSLELWSQRVNLLLDISSLYETSLRREYHQMASL
jgi:hypothetical protein